MESTRPQQTQNHMITPIEKIPLKTSGNTNDEINDDPMIRDVLNEFEKELAINETPNNKYKINEQPLLQSPSLQNPLHSNQNLQQVYQQPTVQLPIKPIKKKCYIDNELIVKSVTICLVVAIIINPFIYSTFLSKVPENISLILDSNSYFIKLILIFIAIYALYFYNLL